MALPNPPDKKVSKKDDLHARRLYKKGDRAYAEGRYADAVTAFEEAYALSGRPLLLFNLGNAYERLERYQDAAEALDRYLPDAKPREQDAIEKRIENLKRRAKKQEEAKEREKEAKKAERRKHASVAVKKHEHHEPKAGTSSSALGYVFLGTGGAALVVGGVFSVMALSARHDEQSNCATTSGQRLCTTDADSAIQRDQRYSLAADIGFGVGIVAAGVGAYLVLGSHHEKEAAGTERGFTSALGARPRPGGGELDLVGAF